jgi:hypothetical protein
MSQAATTAGASEITLQRSRRAACHIVRQGAGARLAVMSEDAKFALGF